MENFNITAEHIDEQGYFCGDISEVPGHLIAPDDLGRIKFRRSLKVGGDLVFGHKSGLQVDGEIDVSGRLAVGCGIIALEDIFSGEGITAGSGIQSLNGKIIARGSIKSGRSLISGNRLVSAEGAILSGENIFSARDIDAATDIFAERGISANEKIRCFESLTAGRGITAGLSIDCKTLSCDLRVMAGLCRFRLPQPEETEVRFETLVKGDIAFGRAVQKQNSPA